MDLLLIPGLLCTSALYGPQLDEFKAEFNCHVVDHRGEDGLAALARHVLKTAPRRFALAGLSMGGYIAMEMIRQAPERISRLVLFDTSARPDLPEQTAKRKELVAKANSGQFDQVVETLIANFVHPDRHSDAALMTTLRQMAQETGAEAFSRQQQAIMKRIDSRPSLAAIDCPVAIVVGAQDALTPPELSREMAGLIPGAALHEIADCGHLATLEQPAAVNAVMRDWLARKA